MKRVTGIGGVFFTAKDAPALQAWYKRHLGIDVQEWGGTAFTWADGEGRPVAGTTRRKQGGALATACRPMTRAIGLGTYLRPHPSIKPTRAGLRPRRAASLKRSTPGRVEGR
jgi:hypothetical protein